MNKRVVLVGLGAAAIVAAILVVSVQICYVTATMPPREQFEMNPVAR